MMAVGFAVGRDADHLAIRRSGLREAINEGRTRLQDSLERDRVGDRAVIEENCDRATRTVGMEPRVRNTRVDGAVAHRFPLAVADAPDASRLIGGENDELDSLLDQGSKRLRIARRLGKPERLGLAPEPMAEVGDSPANLGAEVARIAERQNRVPISLGDRVPMPAAGANTVAIRLKETGQEGRVLPRDPREKRRPEVEASRGVRVDDPLDPSGAVADPGMGIRAIALAVDPLVPVMMRRGARLPVDAAGPRILAGRLIEMAVDDEGRLVFFHGSTAADPPISLRTDSTLLPDRDVPTPR